MDKSNSRDIRFDAFVAMCFDTRLDHVYYKVIKPVLEIHSFCCQRADEIMAIGQIIEQIKNYIQNSHLFVCDLTFDNPNVYYELGIAHTFNKTNLIISQSPANIPFDVKHMRIIPYEDTKTGLLDLRDKFEEFLENLKFDKTSTVVPKAHPFHLTMNDLEFQRHGLFSNSIDIKRYAIKFLGDCRDKESYKTIEGMALIERNSDLLREAFTALYKIKPKEARNLLIISGLFHQNDYLVREQVIFLLGNYYPDKELLKKMSDQSMDSSWGVRRAICMVLGKWGLNDKLVVLSLERLLSDPESKVRFAAAEALLRIQEKLAVENKNDKDNDNKETDSKSTSLENNLV